MPLLSAGLEAARREFGCGDFEGCWLGSLPVAAAVVGRGRVSVTTVVSRVHPVGFRSSFRSLIPDHTDTATSRDSEDSDP